jgi:hypothetical protein
MQSIQLTTLDVDALRTRLRKMMLEFSRRGSHGAKEAAV